MRWHATVPGSAAVRGWTSVLSQKKLEQIEKRSPVIDSAFYLQPTWLSLQDCKIHENNLLARLTNFKEKQAIPHYLPPPYLLAACLNFIIDCSTMPRQKSCCRGIIAVIIGPKECPA